MRSTRCGDETFSPHLLNSTDVHVLPGEFTLTFLASYDLVAATASLSLANHFAAEHKSMAAKNVADERVVYLAFNTIFQGKDSQIRKLKSIRGLVSKHTQQPPVAQLLEAYDEQVIYEQLQKLLVGQVFESTVKAKCEFPELFEVSEAQSAERAISEAEAVEDHEKAVEEAIASHDSHDIPHESDSDSGEYISSQAILRT